MILAGHRGPELVSAGLRSRVCGNQSAGGATTTKRQHFVQDRAGHVLNGLAVQGPRPVRTDQPDRVQCTLA